MKHSVIITCLVLLLCPIANATLIELENSDGQVVFDTNTNQYWYSTGLWDFGFMNYDQQIAAIDALNQNGGYYGIDSWHMADLTEVQTLAAHSTEAVGRSFQPSEQYSPGDNWTWEEDDTWWRKLWDGRIDSYWNEESTAHSRASIYAYYSPEAGIDWKPFKFGENLYYFDDYALFDMDEVEDWIGAWVTSNPIAPIPEPSTILLFATGIGIFIGKRKIFMN